MNYGLNIKTLQASLPVRYEMFEGRRHAVVPVVILVEGVHHGASGCYYYPASELADIPESWNGIPIPVFHPEEYGMAIPANRPNVIQERSVGRLFNVWFDAHGSKLRGEVWIDEEKAEKIDPAVLPIILNGDPLEVSSGLWFDTDGVPGMWHGEEYQATVSNFRPDHLALLPGMEGACSWTDGCGIRSNQTQNGGDMNVIFNIRSTARTPSFDGTESVSWAGVKKGFADYRDAYYRAKGNRPEDVPSRVQDAPAAMKTWIASKTLLGEGGADNERDLLMFPVVNPGTGKLNEGALRAVISGRGSQADIPDTAKKSAQDKARNMLNQHFDAGLETQESVGLKKKLVAALRNVGAALGLSVLDMSHEDIRVKLQRVLDALDNPGWRHWVREVFDDSVVYVAEGTNPSEVGVSQGVVKMYRRGYTLNEETGEVNLKDDAKEVREETNYVPVGPTGNLVNPKRVEDKTMDPKKDRINALIACEQTRFTADDAKWLESLSEEQLDKLGINESEPAKKPDEPGGKETPLNKPAAPDTPPATEKPKVDNEPAGNKKPVGVKEYIAAAPPEIQETLSRAVARDEAVKDALVKAVIANARNQFTEEQLRAKTIGELEQITALAAVEVDFSGQTGGPAAREDKVPAMPPSYEPAKA